MPVIIPTQTSYNLSGVSAPPAAPNTVRRVLNQTTSSYIDLPTGSQYDLTVQVVQVSSAILMPVSPGKQFPAASLEFYYQISNVTNARSGRPLQIAIRWPASTINYADFLTGGSGLIAPNTFQTNPGCGCAFLFQFNLGLLDRLTTRQFFVGTTASQYLQNVSQNWFALTTTKLQNVLPGPAN